MLLLSIPLVFSTSFLRKTKNEIRANRADKCCALPSNS